MVGCVLVMVMDGFNASVTHHGRVPIVMVRKHFY